MEKQIRILNSIIARLDEIYENVKVPAVRAHIDSAQTELYEAIDLLEYEAFDEPETKN